jgi:His Kinase A (phospho-acceptor) domain
MQLCQFVTAHFDRFPLTTLVAIPNSLDSLNTVEHQFMHFDDRLATMLAFEAPDDRARAAIWTQLVDLLAQDKGARADHLTRDALTKLRRWRAIVPERRRLASAVSIAGRPISSELVRFFAEDTPVVAAPILVRAPLTGEDWTRILPSFPPASRALIRERRDLPDMAQVALRTFGMSDFALPVVAAVEGAVPELLLDTPVVDELPDAVPIGELVRRIEAYRKRTPVRSASPRQASIAGFAFETGSEGQITWVEGAPRGPLIGLIIAEPAHPNGPGVDGVAAGAFRKRAAFRDANLQIGGSVDLAGDWSLTAQPFFEPQSGRFEGYRGVAKRKISRRASETSAPKPFGGNIRPDSMRQLVHELRTPLNAVRGFAEMIEGEFLGPVAPEYRHRARSIVSDSGLLLGVFEELDLAARLVREEELTPNGGNSDLVTILRASALISSSLSAERSAHLQVALPDESVHIIADETNSARMIDRLLACVLATAEPGEVIRVCLRSGSGMARVELDRPIALRGVAEAILFDPSFEPNDVADKDLIPLGIAFVLRLIRQLARRAHGHFDVNADQFVLILPLLSDRSDESLETS